MTLSDISECSFQFEKYSFYFPVSHLSVGLVVPNKCWSQTVAELVEEDVVEESLLGEQGQLLLLHQGRRDRLQDRLELRGNQVPQHHLLRPLLLAHTLVVGKVECYCLN